MCPTENTRVFDEPPSGMSSVSVRCPETSIRVDPLGSGIRGSQEPSPVFPLGTLVQCSATQG